MSKDNFFDRKTYLDILEKRILDLKEGYRQNVAIIGDELVGKTSIIFKLLNKLCDNRIIPVYLEVRPESLKIFAHRFIGVLLYNFLSNSGIALKEDVCFLIKRAQGYIPETTKKIQSIILSLEKRKKNNVLADLFSLCDTINQETGKFGVVILDEFHNLEGMGVKNLYRDWSRLLILQKNTLYIIISSLKFKTKSILSKNLSLLFGNFEVVEVEPFDIKTSKEYLRHKLQGMNIDAGLESFLFHFTGGYPFYLEIVTEALQKYRGNNLADVLENILFEPAGILNQKFSNYLKRFMDTPFSQDYLAILYSISCGHNKVKDVGHLLKRQKKELNLRINYLLEIDAITRNGDFLKVNDRVFGFWLRFVYQGKTHSLTFDAKTQKELFRKNIEEMIREFLFEAKKSFAERMQDLMRMFQDDIVQIETKRFRLSNFREIKPLELGNKALRDAVIGRSQDSLWIMAFKYDQLTEEDITVFAKECKKYHHKLQRKIIVALRDVDTNARLRALEEKIWTWDINRVNQILDLFSKPRVVV
jgi:hypothetical protein